MNPVTFVFTILGTLIVILAVLAVGRLLKSWRLDVVEEEGLDPVYLALLDEKTRLLQTLHDLQHEHELGKLSDEDYEGLKRHFERETLTLLSRIDVIEKANVTQSEGSHA